MKKLIINGNVTTVVEFTQEEADKRASEKALAEQQAILDSLMPTTIEISKAERELETITLLQEIGVDIQASAVEVKLVDAYLVSVMARKINIEDVPIEVRDKVKAKKIKREKLEV